MNIHEMYGRLAEQHQEHTEMILASLQLLRDLKEGKVTLERVEVSDSGWEVKP